MDLLKSKGVKGLFSKQKVDPEFVERQNKTRQAFLKNLSRAVKETQLLFTRTEGGVLKDSRTVQRLCARFEDILRHGLKASWFTPGKQPTFWSVVLRISRKQAIDYINGLQYAQSDNGRCRAWIRLAANECSLESYINILCQETQLLNQYYEVYAFLRDEEVVSPLKHMLTGLSQILFDITVDTASLEFALAPEALEPALRLRAPQSVEGHRGERELDGAPSSTSSPVASSDSSSWMSSSTESSSILQDTNTISSKVDDQVNFIQEITEKEKDVEIVRDNVAGIEASMCIDDDAVVVEVLSQGKSTSVAYTDLQRFDNVLSEEVGEWNSDVIIDNEEEGISVDERIKEETIVANEIRKKSLSPFMDDASVNESTNLTSQVLPQSEESLLAELIETQPEQLHPLSATEQLLDETPPIEPLSSVSSQIETLQSSSIAQLMRDAIPPSRPPPFSIIQESSQPRSSSEPPLDDHGPTDNLESLQTNSLGSSPVKREIEKEEYSFTEILRLATGLSPSREVKENKEKLSHNEKKDDDDFQRSNHHDSNQDQFDSNQNQFDSNQDQFDSNQDQEKNDLHFQIATSITNEDGLQVSLEEAITPMADPINPFFDEVIINTPISTESVLSTNPFSDNYVPQESLPPDNINPFVAEIKVPTASLTNPFSSDYPSESSPSPSNPFFESGVSFSKVKEEEVAQTNMETRDQSKSDNDFIVTDGKKNRSDFVMQQLELLTSEELTALILEENHFEKEPTLGEIESRVLQLKNYLRRDSSDVRLQKTLVQLQLLKQKMIEALEDSFGEEVCGHKLELIPRGLRGKKCDTCNKPLIGLLRRVLKCKTCGYLTHSKCVPNITHKCLTITLKEQCKYNMEICPEKGLTIQYFRCSSCNQALNQNSTEVRLCDYTGLYYCPDCHHNDLAIIPARVLHNWDFSLRRVCSSCCELLNALRTRPLISIQLVNSSLYSYVHDISAVEGLRNDIMMMKDILVKCERAREEKLLQELDPWAHFKDTVEMFALSDLVSIQDGSLLPQIQAVHKIFFSHIVNECEVCSSRGQICQLCHSRDVLFSFSKDSTLCSVCMTQYHRDCFLSAKTCPVCLDRRKSRLITTLKK